MQMLTHVGVELVVMTGLTFWLNHRINNLSGRQNSFEDRLKKVEDVLGVFGNALKSHETMFRSMTGGRVNPPRPVAPKSPTRSRKSPEPKRTQKPPPQVVEEEEDEDTLQPEQLDSMLSEELEQLEAERSASSEDVEVDFKKK